jgi:hypothetical protein
MLPAIRADRGRAAQFPAETLHEKATTGCAAGQEPICADRVLLSQVSGSRTVAF